MRSLNRSARLHKWRNRRPFLGFFDPAAEQILPNKSNVCPHVHSRVAACSTAARGVSRSHSAENETSQSSSTDLHKLVQSSHAFGPQPPNHQNTKAGQLWDFSAVVTSAAGPALWQVAASAAPAGSLPSSALTSASDDAGAPYLTALDSMMQLGAHLPRLASISNAALRESTARAVARLTKGSGGGATNIQENAAAAIQSIGAAATQQGVPDSELIAALAQVTASQLARKRYADVGVFLQVLADSGAVLSGQLLQHAVVSAIMTSADGSALQHVLSSATAAGVPVGSQFWHALALQCFGTPHMSALQPLVPMFLAMSEKRQIGVPALMSVLAACQHTGSSRRAPAVADAIANKAKGANAAHVPLWATTEEGITECSSLSESARVLVWSVLDGLHCAAQQAADGMYGTDHTRLLHFNTAGSVFNALVSLKVDHDCVPVPLWRAFVLRLLASDVVALPSGTAQLAAAGPFSTSTSTATSSNMAPSASLSADESILRRIAPEWEAPLPLQLPGITHVPVDAMLATALAVAQCSAERSADGIVLTPGALQRLAAMCVTGHDGCGGDTLAAIASLLHPGHIAAVTHDGVCSSLESERRHGVVKVGAEKDADGSWWHPCALALHAMAQVAPPDVTARLWASFAGVVFRPGVLQIAPGSELSCSDRVFLDALAAVAALPPAPVELCAGGLKLTKPHPVTQRALAAACNHADAVMRWQLRSGVGAAGSVVSLGAALTRACLRQGDSAAAGTAAVLTLARGLQALRSAEDAANATSAGATSTPGCSVQQALELLAVLCQVVEFNAGQGPHALFHVAVASTQNSTAGQAVGAAVPVRFAVDGGRLREAAARITAAEIASPSFIRLDKAAGVVGLVKLQAAAEKTLERGEGGIDGTAATAQVCTTAVPVLMQAALQAAAAKQGKERDVAHDAVLSATVRSLLSCGVLGELPALLHGAALQGGGTVLEEAFVPSLLRLLHQSATPGKDSRGRGGSPPSEAPLSRDHARVLAAQLLRWSAEGVMGGALDQGAPEQARGVLLLAAAVPGGAQAAVDQCASALSALQPGQGGQGGGDLDTK